MLTSNKAVYGTDGSLTELGQLKGSGSTSGKLVIIDDLEIGTPYVIDDTNISAFAVSFIQHYAVHDTFVLPAIIIYTSNIVENVNLYCQPVLEPSESGGVQVEMSLGCWFTRRSDGKVVIDTNNISVEDISIGYFTK